jgi:hypothetical protein
MKTLTVLALLAMSLPAAAQNITLDGAWRCTPSVRRPGYDFCVDLSPHRVKALKSRDPGALFIAAHAAAAVRHPDGMATFAGSFVALCNFYGASMGAYQVLTPAQYNTKWEFDDTKPGTEPEYSASALCPAAALKVSK